MSARSDGRGTAACHGIASSTTADALARHSLLDRQSGGAGDSGRCHQSVGYRIALGSRSSRARSAPGMAVFATRSCRSTRPCAFRGGRAWRRTFVRDRHSQWPMLGATGFLTPEFVRRSCLTRPHRPHGLIRAKPASHRGARSMVAAALDGATTSTRACRGPPPRRADLVVDYWVTTEERVRPSGRRHRPGSVDPDEVDAPITW